jgi:gluconate 2-dehydrogenase gamma chain
MSEETKVSRRDLIARAGAALAAGRMLSAQETQHVHDAVAEEKQGGPYRPKALTAHEYATLQRLSDLILPADEHSKGALAAGSADFIDFLCNASGEMREIYTGGLMWIDNAMQHRYGKTFVDAAPDQQTALLDRIAYRRNATLELNPGIEFFSWVRRMVVDAYYTTPMGFKEVGYMGNSAMSHFSVPQEAVDYVMKRSPLG